MKIKNVLALLIVSFSLVSCSSVQNQIVLGERLQADDLHKINIVRLSHNEDEANLINIAENTPATFGKMQQALEIERERLRLPISSDPDMWWYRTCNGIRIPYTISGSTVEYYSDVIKSFRAGSPSPEEWGGQNPRSSEFTYIATIAKMENYNFNTQQFEECYCIRMQLKMGYIIGGLNAMQVEISRIIILDPDGRVIEIKGDDPVGILVS